MIKVISMTAADSYLEKLQKDKGPEFVRIVATMTALKSTFMAMMPKEHGEGCNCHSITAHAVAHTCALICDLGKVNPLEVVHHCENILNICESEIHESEDKH